MLTGSRITSRSDWPVSRGSTTHCIRPTYIRPTGTQRSQVACIVVVMIYLRVKHLARARARALDEEHRHTLAHEVLPREPNRTPYSESGEIDATGTQTDFSGVSRAILISGGEASVQGTLRKKAPQCCRIHVTSGIFAKSDPDQHIKTITTKNQTNNKHAPTTESTTSDNTNKE